MNAAQVTVSGVRFEVRELSGDDEPTRRIRAGELDDAIALCRIAHARSGRVAAATKRGSR